MTQRHHRTAEGINHHRAVKAGRQLPPGLHNPALPVPRPAAQEPGSPALCPCFKTTRCWPSGAVAIFQRRTKGRARSGRAGQCPLPSPTIWCQASTTHRSCRAPDDGSLSMYASGHNSAHQHETPPPASQGRSRCSKLAHVKAARHKLVPSEWQTARSRSRASLTLWRKFRFNVCQTRMSASGK